MTRIVSIKYQCAYCHNELTRHQVTSFSTFFNKEDIFNYKNTFTGLFPKLYFCPQCGYIGEDLSIEPNKEIKEIIESSDYQLFLKIGDKYNPYFQHFLLGYTLMKLDRYREAILHLTISLSYDRSLFLIESPVYDLLDQRDVPLDIVANNTNDPGDLLINDLIVDCSKYLNFQEEDNFLLIHASIDALRRIGKVETSLVLIDLALKKDFSPEQKELLKQEKELCSNTETLTIIKVVEEEDL